MHLSHDLVDGDVYDLEIQCSSNNQINMSLQYLSLLQLYILLSELTMSYLLMHHLQLDRIDLLILTRQEHRSNAQ